MFFGSWAIGTAVVCLIGFSYMFYASLFESKIENAESESSES